MSLGQNGRTLSLQLQLQGASIRMPVKGGQPVEHARGFLRITNSTAFDFKLYNGCAVTHDMASSVGVRQYAMHQPYL